MRYDKLAGNHRLLYGERGEQERSEFPNQKEIALDQIPLILFRGKFD